MIQKNEKLFLAISKIYFSELSDIESITENPDGTSSITFASGKDWSELYFSKGSGVFSQKHKSVDEGDLFTQSVELSYPGDGIETQQQLKSLFQKPLVIKMQFSNCSNPFSKIIGTLDNPCFFSEDFKNQDYSSKRDISFMRQSTYPAPFLS